MGEKVKIITPPSIVIDETMADDESQKIIYPEKKG